MGRWGRDELEEAFAHYQRVALTAGTSGDWNPWADLFTEDATYIEHLYGTLGGREAIRTWITTTMAQPVNRDMQFFPIEWYVIDGNRVVAYCWNVFDPLPGMTGEYKFAVAVVLEYAGDGLWSLEEDIYNAKETDAVLARFLEDAAKAGHDLAPPPS